MIETSTRNCSTQLQEEMEGGGAQPFAEAVRRLADEALYGPAAQIELTGDAASALARLAVDPHDEVRAAARVMASTLVRSAGDEVKPALQTLLKQAGCRHVAPQAVVHSLEALHHSMRESGCEIVDDLLRLIVVARHVLGASRCITAAELGEVRERIAKLDPEALADAHAMSLKDAAVPPATIRSLLYTSRGSLLAEWRAAGLASETALEIRRRLEAKAPPQTVWWRDRRFVIPATLTATFAAGCLFFWLLTALFARDEETEDKPAIAAPAAAPKQSSPVVEPAPPFGLPALPAQVVQGPVIVVADDGGLGKFELLELHAILGESIHASVFAKAEMGHEKAKNAGQAGKVPRVIPYHVTEAARRLPVADLVQLGAERLLGSLAERNQLGGARQALLVRRLEYRNGLMSVAVALVELPHRSMTAAPPTEGKPAKATAASSQQWQDGAAPVEVWSGLWTLRLKSAAKGAGGAMKSRVARRTIASADAEDATLRAEAAIVSAPTADDYVLAACVYLREARRGGAPQYRERALSILREAYGKHVDERIARLLVAVDEPENRKLIFEQQKALLSGNPRVEKFIVHASGSPQQRAQLNEILSNWVDELLAAAGA